MSKKLRPNITTQDIACNCGCGFNKLSPSLLDVLQDARSYFGKPIHMNSRNHSACRCKKHNAEIGGIETSKHIPDEFTEIGRAADIEIEGVSNAKVYNYLDRKYSNCLGLGLYQWGVHVDDRMEKAFRWGANRT